MEGSRRGGAGSGAQGAFCFWKVGEFGDAGVRRNVDVEVGEGGGWVGEEVWGVGAEG